MPTSAEADQIHLRVPTQPPMTAVATVAARVLAGRAGLDGADIDAVRDAVGDAYEEFVAVGDPGPLEIHLEVEPGRLRVDLTGTTGTRSITAPS